MFDQNWVFGSRPRWNRVGGLLFTSGLVILLCAAFTPFRCGAQTEEKTEDQLVYPEMNQTQDQQTNATPDQPQGQTTGPVLDQQPDQAGGNQTMSAEQIISILEQEPDILDSIRNQLAQLTSADPTTLSDEVVYERIRQNLSFRVLATNELVKRGYSEDIAALSSGSANTVNGRSAKAAVPQSTKPALTQVVPYTNPDEPQVQRRLSPYKNLPSLSDLYSQFPAAEKKLRRFGSDAFLVETGNANELPMDLPAGPDYVLGPGDNLTVNMWGGRSNRLSATIDRQGQIALPEAGSVMIDGMTIAQAQTAIQKALDTQFHGEHVEISLGRLRTVRVYVVGDVQRPGAYDVSSLSTPLSALYAAGGPTSRGSLRIIRQYRGKQLVRQFDLYDFLLRGVRSNDDRLLPGDTILVPPVGPQVSVEGMVRRPAIYELNGEEGLNQVLDLAGGVLVSASLKQINVERIDAHQSRTMLSLQLTDDQDGLKQELASFKVRDGDDVLITQILPYNAQAVYLEGHVFHPGKYPYRDGMTINDLLHSYQDVMPEPADHAELIRLQPPDFRPVTISFSLPDVLIGNPSIPLHPFDLVRVYSRYEIDSPSVTINGEVLRPGKYPMSQSMTVSDLVRMAGGFRRSAFRDEADLSSYVVQSGQKVMVNHTNVEVQKALDGDKNADCLLQPGDVVSIRRLAGWQDIGATVTVSGEVEHPGGYGILTGERISSILKRAGGLRKEAYPYAAILERIQVRELNEQARQKMIRQIEETPVVTNPNATNGSQTASDIQKSLETQRQQILDNLRSYPASGRLVVNIGSDISKWENTAADIELRAGDTLVIPKKPDFVMASGQVYNPVAISYVPGKNFAWYFKKAGGATSSADRKKIFVLRADGSVVPMSGGWANTGLMDLHMRPGDTIFVPEKIAGASQLWQNLGVAAELLTAVMIPLAVSGAL
jgi:protein involved in polysaccharide export with SLBB domain